MEFQEKHFPAHDGTPLFMRIAQISGEPRGHVVLVHGRGEHSGRYLHVAEAFAARGLKLIGLDLRGHGRSGGKRGDVPSYDALLDDVDTVVHSVRANGTPLFLFGHSMGGQIALNYLIDREPPCRGAIIASPYLRLAFRPERWRLLVAHAIRWFWPSLTMQTTLPWSRLSRDHEHLASFPDLDLMHDSISLRMYDAVKRGAERAFLRAAQLRVPLLLLHGAEDSVTSVDATREFYAAAGAKDKTLAIFPGMLHETHNEVDRERVLVAISDWIEARL
jgi:alpha-beta hydrolase superfamily lysophospholipase